MKKEYYSIYHKCGLSNCEDNARLYRVLCNHSGWYIIKNLENIPKDYPKNAIRKHTEPLDMLTFAPRYYAWKED